MFPNVWTVLYACWSLSEERRHVQKCDSYYGLLKQLPQLLLGFSGDSGHQLRRRDLQQGQTRLLHTHQTHSLSSETHTHTDKHTVTVTHSGHGLSQQRLPTSRRPVQEESARRNDSQPLVHFWMPHVDQQLTHFLKKTSKRLDIGVCAGRMNTWSELTFTSRVSSLPPKSSNFTVEIWSSWCFTLPWVTTRKHLLQKLTARNLKKNNNNFGWISQKHVWVTSYRINYT